MHVSLWNCVEGGPFPSLHLGLRLHSALLSELCTVCEIRSLLAGAEKKPLICAFWIAVGERAADLHVQLYVVGFV